MKVYNPTTRIIKPVSRINLRWFDGIGPGETLIVDDPRAERALIKHGCVEVPDEPIVEKAKSRRAKKRTVKKKEKESVEVDVE